MTFQNLVIQFFYLCLTGQRQVTDTKHCHYRDIFAFKQVYQTSKCNIGEISRIYRKYYAWKGNNSQALFQGFLVEVGLAV